MSGEAPKPGNDAGATWTADRGVRMRAVRDVGVGWPGRVDSGPTPADPTGMPRIEYGVLLVGACLVSFQLGATFGGSAPSPSQSTAPQSGPSSDDGRIAALERRLDALAARELVTPVPAAPAPAAREVVDTATPALVDAVAALRDAVLTVGRGQPAVAAIGRATAQNPSAVQGMLANYQKDGQVQNCDLLMTPLSQVLDRLGRPSSVDANGRGQMTLTFCVAGKGCFYVRLQDGLVVDASVCHEGD